MAELPVDDRHIRVLQAAAEAMNLLARGWQRKTVQDCPRCEYEPAQIAYFLKNWEELAAAAEGTSASGTSRLGRSDPDARRKLVAIRADLELATDKAFTNGRYLTWRSVRWIYLRQNRESYYLARRRELTDWLRAGHTPTPAPEPEFPQAKGLCAQLISRELGWQAHYCEEVA